ncbi:hypothetical protein PG994_008229 [Apiospora phragmitis]|uniref:Uncharacterized protein n=1 Tax=Apiospora phragmitis TaxID=2905665 RepID=A0ABR1UVJ6_9PEZI
MDCLPFPVVCFQCGTDQNPCRCKVVGPTLGFLTTVGLAVRDPARLHNIGRNIGLIWFISDRLLAFITTVLLLRNADSLQLDAKRDT